jgi:maleamate amidohydrolase
MVISKRKCVLDNRSIFNYTVYIFSSAAIPQEDLKMFAKSKFGGKAGYGKKPAIVVVDMTYGFVDDAYPLGCSKMGWPAVRANERLLAKGRALGIPILFTRGYHPKTSTERGRWKNVTALETKDPDPKIHEIVTELKPLPEEVVITKIFPSGFFNTNLVSMLIFHNVDTLIVTGMTTSGCVRATVVDAFSYNFIVAIPEECVGDRGLVSHKVSLFDMHMKYADVAPLSEVLGYLETANSRR